MTEKVVDLHCEECGTAIDGENDHLFVGRDDHNLVLCVRHGRGRKDVEFWPLPQAYMDFRYGPEKFGMHQR